MLFRSSGGIQSIIPNVEQQTLTEAQVMIRNDGFEVGEITYEFNDLPADMVISQTPKSGIKMPQGTVVDIVVSQGLENENLIVPSLETKTIREAEATLNYIKLKLGDITYEVSETIPKGQVISNSKLGEEVEPGTFINIVVSSGTTEETTEPATEETTEVVSSQLKMTITLKTELFTAESEVIKVVMIQGDTQTIVYEKTHEKSEGENIIIQPVVSGTGSARILVYYGDIIRLEQNIEF